MKKVNCLAQHHVLMWNPVEQVEERWIATRWRPGWRCRTFHRKYWIDQESGMVCLSCGHVYPPNYAARLKKPREPRGGKTW